MGKDFAEKYPIARQTFEEADEALGYKLSQVCFEGPEEQLRLTEITQPAILTASIAALRVLERRVPEAEFCGGPQPRRVLGTRGFWHDELCRRSAYRTQSWKVYAGGGPGGSGRDGGNSGHGPRESCRGLPGLGAG